MTSLVKRHPMTVKRFLRTRLRIQEITNELFECDVRSLFESLRCRFAAVVSDDVPSKGLLIDVLADKLVTIRRDKPLERMSYEHELEIVLHSICSLVRRVHLQSIEVPIGQLTLVNSFLRQIRCAIYLHFSGQHQRDSLPTRARHLADGTVDVVKSVVHVHPSSGEDRSFEAVLERSTRLLQMTFTVFLIL